MRVRLLLVTASQEVLDRLLPIFTAEDLEVATATSAKSALHVVLTSNVDLIILDANLPDHSGMSVCAELRRRGIDTSLLMLTDERVRGLRLGADDCVPRFCDTGEMMARIEALIRRMPRQKPTGISRVQFGDVDVDFAASEAIKNGRRVGLTGKEAGLLRYLVEHRNRVISRKEVLKHVWEYDSLVSSRTIDVHIGWLRQKLEDNPQEPRYIKTIRGRGYRFDT